jgi:biotin carboxyl carrier protein
LKLRVNDSDYDVEADKGHAKVNGKQVDLSVGKEGDEISLDGELFTLDFFQEGEPALLIVNGIAYLVVRSEEEQTTRIKELKAPMNGQVVQVSVAQGDEVKKGQVLLILEAMKMENQIKSSVTGRIVRVSVLKGQHVKLGDVLLVFE